MTPPPMLGKEAWDIGNIGADPVRAQLCASPCRAQRHFDMVILDMSPWRHVARMICHVAWMSCPRHV